MQDECCDFYLDPKDLRLALKELAHLWNYMAYLNKIEGGKKLTGPGILSQKTIEQCKCTNNVTGRLPVDQLLYTAVHVNALCALTFGNCLQSTAKMLVTFLKYVLLDDHCHLTPKHVVTAICE